MNKLTKLLGTLAATVSLTVSAQAQSLFEEIPLTSTTLSDSLSIEGEIRSRQVTLDVEAASSVFDKFSPAASLHLDLFPGRSVTLNKTGFDPFMGVGTRLWSGRVEGFEDGHATLILDGKRLIGQVQYGGEVFKISSDVFGTHTIRQIDPESLAALDQGDYVQLPASQIETTTKENAISPLMIAFPTRIRVLMMYTPAAQTQALAAGTTIRDDALLALGLTNTALTNSKMAIYKYKWAGIRGFGQCSYTDPANTLQTLYDITPWYSGSDACVAPHVETQRDNYSADLVAVLSGSGGCGHAWIGPSSGAAYSVTARPCISSHTLAHEIGHNMGLLHDRVQDNAIGTNQSAYNYGLAHPDASTPFRTIMAYPTACQNQGFWCNAVPVFSNTHPGGYWNGVKTGRGLHQTDSAVTRKSLIENWEGVAAYK